MSAKMANITLAAVAMLAPDMACAQTIFPATSPLIRYMGRHLVEDDSVTLAYPGIEIIVDFTGSEIAISGETLGSSAHYNVFIDDNPLPRLDLKSGTFSISLASGLDPEKNHTLRLVRRSEAWIGITRLDSFSLSPNGRILAKQEEVRKKLLCIGDSITCGEKADLYIGYVEKGPTAWNAEQSYAWHLAKDFNTDIHIVSYGGKGLIRDWQGKSSAVTAPQFFERTLPDNADKRWDHASYAPDLVTICIGTNDFCQGIPNRDDFVPAYIAFVKRIHAVHPEAKVLLISGPWFAAGTPEEEALNRYILETIDAINVNGLNYANHHFFTTTYPGSSRDAHPTAPQHRAMADEIGKTITNWLDW